jgi:hypothetical protein
MSATDLKSYFKGEPKAEEQLRPAGPSARYPWLQILHSIEPGTGREVIMTQSTCKTAIERLEREGKVRKGEYYSISKVDLETKKRHHYIVHRAKKAT